MRLPKKKLAFNKNSSSILKKKLFLLLLCDFIHIASSISKLHTLLHKVKNREGKNTMHKQNDQQIRERKTFNRIEAHPNGIKKSENK